MPRTPGDNPPPLLRRYRPDDLDDLVRLADNPNVARYLADRFPHPYRREDGEAWLKVAAAETRPCNFAIEWRGKFVGGMGLEPCRDIFAGTAEVGYWLGEPYWGRDIVSRALADLVRVGFDDHLFLRLQAHVFAENIASMRVLEKNGFEREGVLRKHIRKNGVIHDAVLYAKLRTL